MNIITVVFFVQSIFFLLFGLWLNYLPPVKPAPCGGFMDDQGYTYNIVPKDWAKIYLTIGGSCLIISISSFLKERWFPTTNT